MMRGMYAAISGLEAHQTMLDVTANNLANVDTIGYKAQRTTFVDQLSQMLATGTGVGGGTGGSNFKQVGLGVQIGSIDNKMSDGSLQSTGDALDVAIEGPGFLRVAGPGGGTEYTRAGNLATNSAGDLTTATGLYVLDKNNAHITVPAGATDLAIGQDGTVSYVDPATGNRANAGVMSLATFVNDAGLQRLGGSMWGATANSGTPTVGNPNATGFGKTVAGSLEMSNVDMATEFTNMITAERGYQANSRVITTADQMLQSLVQMVG